MICIYSQNCTRSPCYHAPRNMTWFTQNFCLHFSVMLLGGGGRPTAAWTTCWNLLRNSAPTRTRIRSPDVWLANGSHGYHSFTTQSDVLTKKKNHYLTLHLVGLHFNVTFRLLKARFRRRLVSFTRGRQQCTQSPSRVFGLS